MFHPKRYTDTLRAFNRTQWGFKLYHNASDAASRALLDSLLATIESSTRSSITSLREGSIFHPTEPSEEVRQQLAEFASMFHLDVERLDSATIDTARALAKRSTDPMVTDHGAVLLVDEDVLRSVERANRNSESSDWKKRTPWVKVIDVEYEHENHRGNSRVPRHYWGWMKAAADCMYVLWGDLEAREMFQLAPGSLDGRMKKVWDGALGFDDEGEKD